MTYPIDVQKIVSMIVQDLRQFNHGAIVDIVKKRITLWNLLTTTIGMVVLTISNFVFI